MAIVGAIMSRTKPNGPVYILTTVNSGTETDHPDIEFDHVLKLLAHVKAAYPQHTSYLITVVRRSN